MNGNNYVRRTEEWIGRLINHNIVLSMAVSFSTLWVSTWRDPAAKRRSLAGGPAANHNQLIRIPPASGQAIVSVKTFIYLVVFSLSAGFYHSYSIEFKMAAWSSFSNTLAATYRVRKRPEVLGKRSVTGITYAYPWRERSWRSDRLKNNERVVSSTRWREYLTSAAGGMRPRVLNRTSSTGAFLPN